MTIDWLNAVIIPLLLSFIVGIPLSLWTGLIAGRYVEFQQRLRDARVIFMSVDRVLMDTKERTFQKNELLRTQAIIQGTLFDQGQFIAQSAFNSLCESMWKIYAVHEQQVAAAIAQLDLAANQDAFAQFNQECTALMTELQKIRPSIVSLLLGKTLTEKLIRAHFVYENLCEYLETGQSLAEIHKRRLG